MQVLVTVRFYPRSMIGWCKPTTFSPKEPEKLIKVLRAHAVEGPRNLFVMDGEHAIDEKKVRRIAERLSRYSGVQDVMHSRGTIKVWFALKYVVAR